jgi:hypothetical protein
MDDNSSSSTRLVTVVPSVEKQDTIVFNTTFLNNGHRLLTTFAFCERIIYVLPRSTLNHERGKGRRRTEGQSKLDN